MTMEESYKTYIINTINVNMSDIRKLDELDIRLITAVCTERNPQGLWQFANLLIKRFFSVYDQINLVDVAKYEDFLRIERYNKLDSIGL